MRYSMTLPALLLALSVGACGGKEPTIVQPPPDTTVTPPPPPPPPPPPVMPVAPAMTAIINASLITMTSEGVQPGMTVIVRNGLIESIAPSASTTPPDSAMVIDAEGAFLMPGLADMHTHLSVVTALPPNGLPGTDRQQGLLLVANGVTTVMNMGDFRGHDLVALRESFARRESPGPHMILGRTVRGPGDGGGADYEAAGATDAERMVRGTRGEGYDFVKVYTRLGLPAFNRAVSTARSEGLPVYGHIPTAAGLSGSLNGGIQNIAHVGELLTHAFQGRVDPDLLPSVVDQTVRSGTWVTTTLSASEGFRMAWGNNVAGFESMLARPGVRFTHQQILQRWTIWLNFGTVPGQLDGQMPFLGQITKAISSAGGRIVLGTDAPDVAGVVSGFSVHNELRLLSEAGFSPFEALATATRNAGTMVQEHFSDQPKFGTIEPGNRGDLLLLSQNPLADLSALEARIGVMVAGEWYLEADLQARLEALIGELGR